MGGPSSEPSEKRPRAPLTLRALLIGLAGAVGTAVWVNYEDIVLATMGRGVVGMHHTSVPLAALDILLILVLLNPLLRRISRRWAFSQPEMMVVYVMTAVGPCVIGVGAVLFLIPTLTAPFHYATPENHWAKLFHQFIPNWIGPRDPAVIESFYLGQSQVPYLAWLRPLAIWTIFLMALAFATLCICAILRKQWLDRERLTFPTLFLPVAITEEQGSFWRDKVMWVACIGTIAVITMNNIGVNLPMVPVLKLRGEINPGQYLINPPWNAVGNLNLTFYPIAIGLGYLIPLEMAFSCWFFYLMSKAQLVLGALLGWGETAQVTGLRQFPFFGYQGAGAFLGLAIFTLWLERRHLGQVLRAALSRRSQMDDSEEPLSYRWAVWGLVASFAIMLGVFVAAGASPIAPFVFLVITFVYLIAGTRIWGESGVAWLAGPRMEPYRLMTSTLGTGAFSPRTLTMLSYVRFQVGYDLRYMAMPRQMDGLKMADIGRVNSRHMAFAIMLALFACIVFGLWTQLIWWYQYGAEVKANSYMTNMGRQTFDLLATDLENPTDPNRVGIGFGAGAMAFTGLLTLLSNRLTWWPFHPLGYVFSMTPEWTIGRLWCPFFIAWLVKLLLLRYGGMKLYRRGMPFFLGLILGDAIASGPAGVLACHTHMSVYITNW